MKSNQQRATNAIILIWIVLAVDIISAISSYMQIDLLQRFNDGEFFFDADIDANDKRETVVGVLYAVVYLISATTFIMWFRRAYNNLHIKVKNLSYSEGAAAWTWFVPIINLFRPFNIMKEMYGKTAEYLAEKGVRNRLNLSTTVVSVWWALWIINNFFAQFVTRYARKAETIDTLITSSWLHIISTLIFVPLSFFAVNVIKRYSEAEDILIKIKPDEND